MRNVLTMFVFMKKSTFYIIMTIVGICIVVFLQKIYSSLSKLSSTQDEKDYQRDYQTPIEYPKIGFITPNDNR